MIASFALVAGSLTAMGASASASTVSSVAASSKVTPQHFAKHYAAGVYIVQLKNQPVSTYTGGVKGYSATRPAKGHQLNAKSSSAQAWSKHLASQQSNLASKYGVSALSRYTIAYNGFGAKLTAAQATSLAADSNVVSLTRDKLLKVQDDTLTSKSSLNYLGVADVGSNAGLWSTIGGHEHAGEGVVVGDIDTGISPENPAFAGDALPTCSSPTDAGPCVTDGVIQFTKGDTQQFTSTEVSGNGWASSDYNQKLIGAKYFDAGFLEGGASLPAAPAEYTSPRDGDGHGSHTASTAIGDYGNDASIGGTDYGTISGVAPAAKIAMYKACWTATDDELTGCDEVDLLAAINQAVTDGVDVINFSIGGDGGANTTYSPTDEAFLNAAAAGIFVSAAAGNAGPGASTLDNASPWITTVAASSIPSYSAKATLGNGVSYTGASITVNGSVTPGQPSTQPITGARLILAESIKTKHSSLVAARGCATGALKPITTANTVVVCDREGIYDRTEKSQTVADAGGVGMVLVNTIPEDIDADAHSVPSVHLDFAARAAIRAYAKKSTATVSFTPVTDDSPVPQVAGFSSRGPVTAADGDILKPDITAPGVSILAAVASVPNGSHGYTPKYGLDSGTSMATPHIAGFAALYLGVHPTASPASIKSALMTTATNTVSATGSAVTDPFVQGAGEVNAAAFLNAGLIYDSNATDWKAYVDGTGQADLGVTAIDPSNLNEPSIAIGNLSATQTVTRTVTALTAGHYVGAITGLTGITATLSDPTLDFDNVGDQKQFSVTFARTTAPVNKYETGFLTWTNGSTVVRSPIAIQPIAAPAAISGTGTNGHATLPAAYGVKKGTSLHVYGLATATTLTSGTMTPDDVTEGNAYPTIVSVGSTTSYLKFSSTATGGDDSATLVELDVLYRSTASRDPNNYTKLVGYSAAEGANQTVTINKPRKGSYVLWTVPLALDSNVDFSQTETAVKTSGGSGHLTVSPTKTPASPGTVQVRWGGLETGGSYLGVIRYGSGSAYTVVSVDASTATAPENYSIPTISGKLKVGSKLTASAGTWNISTKYFTSLIYQWLRGGLPLPGATKSTYKFTSDDVGGELSVQVTATSGTLSTTVTSNEVPAP